MVVVTICCFLISVTGFENIVLDALFHNVLVYNGHSVILDIEMLGQWPLCHNFSWG